MAAKTPLTKEEMLKVSGVGQAKMEKYGESTKKPSSPNYTAPQVKNPKSKIPKVDFCLSPDEAGGFKYEGDLTAGALAAKLSDLRDKNSVKRLVGTTITASIEEKGLAKITYPKGHLPAVDISPEGKAFGLFKIDKTSAAGNHYKVLMYSEGAQKNVLKWYTQPQNLPK